MLDGLCQELSAIGAIRPLKLRADETGQPAAILWQHRACPRALQRILCRQVLEGAIFAGEQQTDDRAIAGEGQGSLRLHFQPEFQQPSDRLRTAQIVAPCPLLHFPDQLLGHPACHERVSARGRSTTSFLFNCN
jgi:hypothetical protein